MEDMLKIGGRYFPLHNIAYVEDNGEQMIISVRDLDTGPNELRLQGEEAEKLRTWLDQRVAVSLASQSDAKDTGYRSDD